jgi:hypothetical protein
MKNKTKLRAGYFKLFHVSDYVEEAGCLLSYVFVHVGGDGCRLSHVLDQGGAIRLLCLIRRWALVVDYLFMRRKLVVDYYTCLIMW